MVCIAIHDEVIKISGLSHYSPHEIIAPPLWYIYHDWGGGGAIGYLTTKLGGGGGGYNGKDPKYHLSTTRVENLRFSNIRNCRSLRQFLHKKLTKSSKTDEKRRFLRLLRRYFSTRRGP